MNNETILTKACKEGKERVVKCLLYERKEGHILKCLIDCDTNVNKRNIYNEKLLLFFLLLVVEDYL